MPRRRRPSHGAARRRLLASLAIGGLVWTTTFAALATTTAAAAGDPATVIASGSFERFGPGNGSTTFEVDATSDGTAVSGTFSLHSGSSSPVSGTITCLSVTGQTALVGGTGEIPSGFGPPFVVAVSFLLTDDNALGDRIAVDGPGNVNPPCTTPTEFDRPLQSGSITIGSGGPAGSGHVTGSGTQTFGFGSDVSFTIDANHDANGIVSGTFTFSQGFSFNQSGQVTCLVVDGTTAVVGVQGAGSGGPFGQPARSSRWTLTDGGGPNGEDTFTADEWSQTSSPDCSHAPDPGAPLTTGDIAITAGPTATPTPTPTPTTGTFGWMSANQNSQPLAGTAYALTGPGVSLTVTDNGPNDASPDAGIFSVADLPLLQTYQVCETTIPANYYANSASCQSAFLSGPSGGGGLTFFHVFVEPLTISPLGTAPTNVPREGRFEASFQLSRFYFLQVFNPDVIDATATFVAPSGAQTTVSAFWTNDYTVRAGTGIGTSEIYDVVPLSPPRPGFWMVRFSPDEVGTYHWSIRAADHQQPGAMTVTGPTQTFSVTASPSHGQVGVDGRDPRFLQYADGTPYLPIGQNAAFEDGTPNEDGTHYYTSTFDSFQAAGENWTRVWMTDFNRSALEWSTGHFSGFYTGVGQYAPQPAWRMDQVLDLAEARGLQVQLVLNDHGQFSTWVNARWDTNPYNSARGGPAATPRDFFTNPAAKQLFKQRLHYLVARYGAYRNLLAWELFNEVQYTGTAAVNPQNNPGMAGDVAAWHSEMAAYLRSIDPYHHLITTSANNDVPPFTNAIWSDPNIDLTQVHDYSAPTGRDATIRSQVSGLQSGFGKPSIVGEFGIGNGDPERHFDPTTSSLSQDLREHLQQGTQVHNGVWTAALSGSGAMAWWWGEYLAADATNHRTAPDFPLNARIFPALSAYVSGEDFAGLGLHDSAITADTGLLAFGQDNGSRGFLWVRDAQNEYGTGARPGDLAGRSLTGKSMSIAGFVNGTYQVDVWSTYGAGGRTGSFVATASGGVLVVPLPAFTRDLALKIRPGGESPAAPIVAGGTLSTDTEGDGATPADPLETTITSPVAGTASIAEHALGGTPPAGYTFFGQQADITAPTASAAQPLVFTFRLDSTLIPNGLAVADIVVFRNGVAVLDCSGPAGQAVPTPCVASRSTVGDDVVIVVRTAQASTWSFGRFDATAPTVDVTSPADGSTFILNSAVTAAFSCHEEANGSGLAGCVGTVPNGSPLDTATVGSHTFTVTGRDVAGNVRAVSRTYKVVWPFTIAPPVDPRPTVNKVNAGAAVPVKFSLGGNRGLGVLGAGPTSGTMTCATSATIDDLEQTAPANADGLSYDAASGLYTYVWKTQKAYSGTCRQLVLSLTDGNIVRFDFTFVK